MAKGRKAGMKRAYLKRFSASMINCGQFIRRPGEYAKEGLLHQYRSHIKNVDDPLPPNKGVQLDFIEGGKGHMIPKRLWQSETRMQGLEHLHKKTLEYRSRKGVLRMELALYFSGTSWFFVETNVRENVRKFSYVYPTCERAMNTYHVGRIQWKEIFALDT